VAIRSTGQLELAPAFKSDLYQPSTFIWSIAADKDGVCTPPLAHRHGLSAITPDGKSATIFEPKELQVQSIALDRMEPSMRPHRGMARCIASRAKRAVRQLRLSSPRRRSSIPRPSTSGHGV